MTLEDKIRILAGANSTLQSYLGTSPFRMFDRQLPPRQINNGACVTVRRVSTVRPYYQQGIQSLSMPRMQFTVYTWGGPNSSILANAPATARAVRDALVAWLASQACFSSSAQFDSPSTAPPNYPNFVLNEFGTLNFQLDPPGYIEVIDVRLMNLEN